VTDTLIAGIDSVFSVLPRGQASEGSREVLERYMGRRTTGATEVPWVDFDRTGRRVRAGVTYTVDLSTRFINDPADHADIRALINGASGRAPEAGRIIHVVGSDRFQWYVPLAFQRSDRSRDVRMKGLVVSAALLGEVVDLFDEDRGITRAEKRLLFQLVAGASLREAADVDGVSVETKRAQVKSLCAKLGCRGQTDLVRRTMGQLVHLLHVTDADTSFARTMENFVRQHLPSRVRIAIHRLGDGQLLRMLECGPSTGQPVLFAHGMLYPLLFINGVAECERLGIRLIMPVRSGYLHDQSAAALYDESDEVRDLDDVAAFVAREAGGSLPIVGHSMGASWALRFARRHPAKVATLILLSPHFAGDRHGASRFAPFLDGLRALTDRPGLFRYVAWQFRKYYVDTKLVRRVLRQLFGGSNDDLAVLDGECGGGPVYEWFAESYRSSIVGVADDMAAGMRGWQEELGTLPCCTTIIYGSDDPVALFARHATSGAFPSLVRIRPLQKGGHLMVASHPAETWNALASALSVVCKNPLE